MFNHPLVADFQIGARALRTTLSCLIALVCTLCLLTAAATPVKALVAADVNKAEFSASELSVAGNTVSSIICNNSSESRTVYLASFQAVGDYTGVNPNDASDRPELLKIQVLYDVDVTVLSPGQCRELTVNLAPCGNTQVDAFVSPDGQIIAKLTGAKEQYEPYILRGKLFLLEDKPCRDEEGRMTGGGSVFTKEGMRVTHGFELHCDVDEEPQRLEVNFAGSRFHLEEVTRMFCYPVLNSNGTTTYHLFGTGYGRLNGVSGVEIAFHFTDTAEPGKAIDIAEYYIQDSSGLVMMVNDSSGDPLINSGNQQWHPAKPGK